MRSKIHDIRKAHPSICVSAAQSALLATKGGVEDAIKLLVSPEFQRLAAE